MWVCGRRGGRQVGGTAQVDTDNPLRSTSDGCLPPSSILIQDTFTDQVPFTSEGRIGNFPWNGYLLRVPFEKNLFRVATFAKDGISTEKRSRASLLVVRAKDGFNSDDGRWAKSNLSTVLGNLVLAVGFTYLTLTGQLGWLVDALVSIWLLAVLLPIVGLGAFFWFAGRDIVQSSCPNCGNSFQIFKSAMKDGVQFCPFCTQPFK
ncbi:hypothetical protein HPP92_001580, partial [Vanilla planifolia]